MRSAAALPLVLALALLLGGCGSSQEPAAPTVPPAKTQPEWITRLVDRFLRDMNQNLMIVSTLGSPQVMIYLQTGNETTIRILKARMSDLRDCSNKLARVGPPPSSDAPLDRIYDNFKTSCPFYERIAGAVLKAVPLLSSGDAKKIVRGQSEFKKANAPSRDAARYYGAAVNLLQRNDLLAQYQGS